MKLSDVLNHFFDLKLLSLLVHSIRLVLSNIMVHSLMVILSLDGVHSWKVALSLVMIHFIPCGTISFHDSLSECGTNWCQGSLEAWFYHELWFSSWLRHYLFWWTTVSILVLSHFRVHCKHMYLSRNMIQSLLKVLSLRLIHLQQLVLSLLMIRYQTMELFPSMALSSTLVLLCSTDHSNLLLLLRERFTLVLWCYQGVLIHFHRPGTIQSYGSHRYAGTIGFFGSLTMHDAVK